MESTTTTCQCGLQRTGSARYLSRPCPQCGATATERPTTATGQPTGATMPLVPVQGKSGPGPAWLRYQPTSLDGIVGHDAALKRLPADLGGRAVWISGPSGTGKTTIATILAASVASGFGTVELDATELTPARLRTVEDGMGQRCIDGRGRAYLINEAHGISTPARCQLLVLIDRLPAHVVLIFTTTRDLLGVGPDGLALMSRCTQISLAEVAETRPAFAFRCQQIARAESLDGQDLTQYGKLYDRCQGNLRQMIAEVESGAMSD